MDFQRDEAHQMLADTLGRYLQERYGIAHRNRVAFQPPFHDAERWQEMVELGTLAALAPEDRGGLGGSGADVLTLFEQLGRALCPEPFLPALMGIRILAQLPSDPDGLLDRVLAGELHCAVAFHEPDLPFGLEGMTTRARGPNPEGPWQLDGTKSAVYGGHLAGVVLVAARTPDDLLALFAVEADAAGIHPWGMIDGGGAATLILDATPARLLAADGYSLLADAIDHGILALCAEAVGLCDVACETTLDWLKTRQQFGRTIGQFQALQHRMVDMRIEIEQARSLTILAASRMGDADRTLTLAMAKNLVGRVAQLVAEESIQLHGGIAMTWEAGISHYAKRLVMLDHQLGDADTHLARVMATLSA